NVGALLDTSGSTEVNPIMDTQQLIDEQEYNAINKVSMEIKERLFRRNNRIKSLEKELEENNKEIIERDNEIKGKESIIT
ncbi:hypothetical protein KI387_041828, partial [Taxus chinensis]